MVGVQAGLQVSVRVAPPQSRRRPKRARSPPAADFLGIKKYFGREEGNWKHPARTDTSGTGPLPDLLAASIPVLSNFREVPKRG